MTPGQAVGQAFSLSRVDQRTTTSARTTSIRALASFGAYQAACGWE